MQLARRARLDRAVELLKETDWSVAQVADVCGFVSGSHLSRHLRGHLGMDASRIRRRARAGEMVARSRLVGVMGGLF